MSDFTYVPLSQVQSDLARLTTRLPVREPQDRILVLPSPLDFGSVSVTAQSKAEKAAVINVSAKAVTIQSIVGAGDFLVSHDCPAVLEPGAYCTITAMMAPTQAGVISGSATVSIGDGDDRYDQEVVQFSGMGLLAASPMTSLSSAQLNFAQIIVGRTSAVQSVAIANIGESPLQITAIAVAGPFTVPLPALPVTIQPNQSIALAVTFAPVAIGAAAGSITLTTNGSGPDTVALTGTGLAP